MKAGAGAACRAKQVIARNARELAEILALNTNEVRDLASRVRTQAPLVPRLAAARPKRLGLLKGKIKVPDDFNAPLPLEPDKLMPGHRRPGGSAKPKSGRKKETR
jgi:hypothetical protein